MSSHKLIAPETAAEWRKLSVQIGHTFTPHKPIKEAGFFSGREALIEKVADAVSLPGRQVIIFGDRGAGKSSLAYTLEHDLREARANITCTRRPCARDSTFQSIWHSLLDEFGDETKTARQILGPKPSTYDVLAFLKTLNRRWQYVFIIDEFDRVEDQSAKTQLADLLKHVSDDEENVTVIIVGIARNVSELFENHASLPRSMQQVKLPRMSPDELRDIIDTRLPELGMDMAGNVKDAIVSLAQGFPGYVHLLALHAARAAVRRKSVKISHQDLEEALSEAIEDVDEVVAKAYRKATDSSRTNNNYADVLLGCALAPFDNQGFFTAKAIGEAMEKRLKKPVAARSFARNLQQFCTKERGPTLFKEGAQYCFEYALLKPYVAMKAIGDGRITIRQVS